MSRKSKLAARIDSGLVEVKSKFDAEFRRFAINRQKIPRFEEFYTLVEQLHALRSIPFTITYTDPEGDLLPINNDDNFALALSTARPVLRLNIQHKGQNVLEVSGYGTAQRRRNKLPKFAALSMNDVRSPHVAISLPEDFRRVSAIIDVDVVPATQRRVRLMKSGVDASKPLGFYIRDGTSIRVTLNGVEKVPAIFISRLVPGGIAESTGLLAVNDEVLEVNGIEVAGKTLDQVTDMMVANSSNMIITVKPANQNNNILRRGAAVASVMTSSVPKSVSAGGSPKSSDSYRSAVSGDSVEALMENEEEEDEVREHVSSAAAPVAIVSAADVKPPLRSAWSSSPSDSVMSGDRKTQTDDAGDISQRSAAGSGRKKVNDNTSSSSSAAAGNLFGDCDGRNSISSKSSGSGGASNNHVLEEKLLFSSASSIDHSKVTKTDSAKSQKTANEAKPPSNVRVIFTAIEDL
jgi:partitioning defective protein 6